MKMDDLKRPVEWASRVNKRWIVHHGLGTRADEWMGYLAATDPNRLRRACEAARFMVRVCDELGDPKPWFYAGLFSAATEPEARRFLAGHRLTTATVPSMACDPEVESWVASLCDETRELLESLRKGLRLAVAGTPEDSSP